MTNIPTFTWTVGALSAVAPFSPTYYEDIAIRNNTLVTVTFPEVNQVASGMNAMASAMNIVAGEIAAASQAVVSTNNYQGAYSAGTAYLKGHSVSYNGVAFVAVQNSTGQTPSNNLAYWTPFTVNALAASGSSYDNAVSGLTATTVQAAIDEVDGRQDTAQATSLSHIPLSGATAYHLLSGSLALANTTVTAGFGTTLYTGNGGVLPVVTGIDLTTQWGNLATEAFSGLVMLKWRSGVNTTSNWHMYDGIRGATKRLMPNTTNAEDVYSGVTSFNNDGFTLGAGVDANANLSLNASWVFQTTHRITGTTNHGQAYECRYNPVSGFTMVKYTGSGIAGHEIPHHVERKLALVTVKNIGAVADWLANTSVSDGLLLNGANAQSAGNNLPNKAGNESVVTMSTSTTNNTATNTYMMYGWADSFHDASNTLIGNYEVGVYQGSGVAGYKVATRGKPAFLMVKRLDSTGPWGVYDNIRTPSKDLYLNTTSAEATNNLVNFQSDGFTLLTTSADNNASGGQYLYMVAYDNDNGSGKSKYPLASDTANLNLNAAIPFANGLDASGAKVTTLTKNETVTGLTFTSGKNYVYCDNTGLYGVSAHKPRYGIDWVRRYAGESPAVYSIKDNQWYNSSAGTELVSNGKNFTVTTGWTPLTAAPATLSVVSGSLRVTNASAAFCGGFTTITTEIGKKYRIEFKAKLGTSGGSQIRVGTAEGDFSYYLNNTTQSDSVTFVANTTTTFITLYAYLSTAGQYCDYMLVTVFEANITTTTPITASRNYLDAEVLADANGQIVSVTQLPKTEYKDILKANEYQGKNACTAWCVADTSTTPVTLASQRFNIKQIIRTATGLVDVYLDSQMDTLDYAVVGNANRSDSVTEPVFCALISKSLTKFTLRTMSYAAVNVNAQYLNIQVFGGKN